MADRAYFASEHQLVWEDSEVRFDVSKKNAAPRAGEHVVDVIEHARDVKGSTGSNGTITLTNLRIIWKTAERRSTSLSIGLGTIIGANVRTQKGRVSGEEDTLAVMTKYRGCRFEFLFSSPGSQTPFANVQSLLRAFTTSRLYRELKLRGAIITDSELRRLEREHIYERLTGVWNLSAEQGNLGIMHITNIRVTWHATSASNFNVSVPYMQMKSIRLRKSKFGLALVFETSPSSGGYVLGFKIDGNKLEDVYNQIISLHQVFSASPIFGVQHQMDEEMKPLADRTVERIEDDVSIVDSGEEVSESMAAYYADVGGRAAAPPRFDASLGLAVEELPRGYSIDSLWSIFDDQRV